MRSRIIIVCRNVVRRARLGKISSLKYFKRMHDIAHRHGAARLLPWYYRHRGDCALDILAEAPKSATANFQINLYHVGIFVRELEKESGGCRCFS